MPHPAIRALVLTFVVAVVVSADRQQTSIDPHLVDPLHWRPIGPLTAGPTSAAVGVAGDVHTFFVGTPGGMWKSSDAGHNWMPVFDRMPVASIGALAVAPSNSAVVYAGTGAIVGSRFFGGSGLYKSADGGATWTAVGLPDTAQIADIAVDPRDPNRVFVAAPGRPFGANAERGVFRSTDGGRTFTRVLFANDNTGAVQVIVDESLPHLVYAVMLERRLTPWPGPGFSGAGTGVFRSSDGGSTWQPSGTGLPTVADDGVSALRIAHAPGTIVPASPTSISGTPARLYAAVEATRRSGIYTSGDGGFTWRQVNDDPLVGAVAARTGALAIDPRNPDVVYAAAGRLWRSTDGGRTFAVVETASAHDARRLWIHPRDPGVMLLSGERGASISLNGGRTWSRPGPRPAAIVAQISIDANFPYRVCGGRVAAAPACVSSVGPADDTMDEIEIPLPPGSAIAAAPQDANLLYGGFVTRYDRRTGQAQTIGPEIAAAPSMAAPMTPVLFSPLDARTLFAATNTVWRTSTGGQTWSNIGPDLVGRTTTPPANLGAYRTRAAAAPPRPAIAAIAASFVDANVIWVGTSDGQVRTTRDGGGTWTEVTPTTLPAWTTIAAIEASHFDAGTAYLVADATRIDDSRPGLLKTRDTGRSWTPIVTGLPPNTPVHVVREDAQRRGLLFAGTGAGAFVSIDDGESWQPLRTNMPAAPILDLAIKEADLVAATAGRGLWVLDDLSPLRQVTPDLVRAPVMLFRPPATWRTRFPAGTGNVTGDASRLPVAPAGVFISYFLRADPAAPVTVEIIETATGDIIRRFSSETTSSGPITDAQQWATLATSRAPASAGLHRVLWDLRYAPPPLLDRAAPAVLAGAFVLPGAYQVRLTVGAASFRQAVLVRMDPRVRTTAADLLLQSTLSKTVAAVMRRLSSEYQQVQRSLAGADANARAALTATAESLRAAYAPLPELFSALQSADARPTAAVEAAVTDAVKRAETILAGG